MTTTTPTITTPSETCAAAEAIEALRSDSILTMLMQMVAERASQYVASQQPGEGMYLGVIFETRTSGGWIVTDWRVEEGTVPGDDVTSLKLQVVYRPSVDDLRYGYEILHRQFRTDVEEDIARSATTMCSEHVIANAASIEILLDDLFLEVLSEYIGVPRTVLETSFCIEAEFASAVITEREVGEFIQEEFARMTSRLREQGVEE